MVPLLSGPGSAIFVAVSLDSFILSFWIQFSTSDGLTVSLSTNTSTNALPKSLNFAVPCIALLTLTLTPSSVQSNCNIVPLVTCPPLSFTPSAIKVCRYSTSACEPP